MPSRPKASSSSGEPPPGGLFYVVLFTDLGEEPTVREFRTVEDLAACLRSLPGTVRGRVFQGRQLFVTRGPWRFLEVDGNHLPLFEPPVPGEVDRSFGLGRAEDDEAPPGDVYQSLVARLEADQQEAARGDAGEEEDEEEDEEELPA